MFPFIHTGSRFSVPLLLVTGQRQACSRLTLAGPLAGPLAKHADANNATGVKPRNV